MIAGLFVLSISAATPPQTVTLFDSTAGSMTGADQIGAGPYASFGTPAGSGLYLSDVKAEIQNMGSGPSSGQSTLLLFADNANAPGPLIATLATVSDASLPAPGATVTMDFPVGPAIALQPAKRYWVGFSAKKSNAGWARTNNFSGTGVMDEGSFFDGKQFSNDPAGPYLMKVVAQTAPTTGSMAQLSSGGGWDTQLTLVNTGFSPADSTLNFVGNLGSALDLPFTFPQGGLPNQTTSTLTETLNSNQMLVLDTNDVSNTAGLTGSAQFTTSGAIDGFAIFRYTPTGQEAVVPLEWSVAPSYILAFDNTGGIVTGLAVANVLSSAASIAVKLRDDTGAVITSGTINLAGNGHTSFPLTDPQQGFPATANKRGTIEFDAPAGGQISVLGLRAAPIAGGAFAVTTIPVMSNVTAGTGSMAQASAGGGWQTTFTLVNTDAANSAQATLAFYDDNGNALSLPLAFPQTGTNATESTVNITLAAGASMIIVANDPNKADVGSAQLTTTGPIGAFAIYQYTPSGQEAVVPLETRNGEWYLLPFDNTNSIVTGVAVANISAQESVLDLRLHDDTGAVIDGKPLVLPPYAHTSFLLTDMFPTAANIRGTLEFQGTGEATSILGLRAAPTGVNGTFAVTSIPALAK